jgi:glycerol-3-phosphate dehydrogenase
MNLKRDVSKFTEGEFDILVIGAGINGAGIAWDAALRGLRVGLIDKADFGGATSSACFKIVHGGLRYLQHLDFTRLYQSVSEQRILRRIAPHLIHPLPFIIPCYGYGKKSKGYLTLGMLLYEGLCFNRNSKVDNYHILPGFHYISKKKCLEIAPSLNQEGLSGGIVYYDCQMSNCERLTFSIVASASSAGAYVANYVEAVNCSFNNTDTHNQEVEIKTVLVRDKLSGKEYNIKTKFVVDATGPWSSSLISKLTSSKRQENKLFSKGIQIILPEIISKYAIAIESSERDTRAILSRGGRSLFIVPWKGCSMIGTTDELYDDNPDNFTITENEISLLLKSARAGYNSDTLRLNNVKYCFGGLRPVTDDVHPIVSYRDTIIDYKNADCKIQNLISVEGTKYTTFRLLAEKVVDKVIKQLSRRGLIFNNTCMTTNTYIYGGHIEDFNAFYAAWYKRLCNKLPKNTITHLVTTYGSNLEAISKIIEDYPDSVNLVSTKYPMIVAELLFSAQSEMVCTISDLVLRRTGLGSMGYPGDEVIQKVSNITNCELGCEEIRQLNNYLVK